MKCFYSKLVPNEKTYIGRRLLVDRYRIHECVSAAAEEGRELFRVEPGQILVQSAVKPDWARVFQGHEYVLRDVQVKQLDISPQVGQRFMFKAEMNPVRQLDGKRQPIPDGELEAWMRRKLQGTGAIVEKLHIEDYRTLEVSRGPRRGNSYMTFAAGLFSGVLSVDRPDVLEQCLAHGIGHGKAFGFGMLSVAPIR